MQRIVTVLCLILGFLLLAVLVAIPAHNVTPALAQEAPKTASPAEGYNIHVLAPHLVDGKQMGPYHHYCKVMAPDPQIVCLIYEWIYAKKMTRAAVPLKEWNKNWHDHAVEIAGGRVQVLDLPPDKAKEVADTVATTDGMIYHFYFDGKLPNGKTSIAQAVGHKPLTESEYKASAK